MTHSAPHVKYIPEQGYRFTNCERYLSGLELVNVTHQATQLLELHSRERASVTLPWLVVCRCLRINDVPICYLDGSSLDVSLSIASALLTGGLSNHLLDNLPPGLSDAHYELLIEDRLVQRVGTVNDATS